MLSHGTVLSFGATVASGFAREWESRREEEMKGREEEGDRVAEDFWWK